MGRGDSDSDADDGDIRLDDDQLHKRLRASAKMVVRTCMQMRAYENTLIVTDPHCKVIGQALYEAASLVSERVLLVMMPSTHQHGDEPSKPVADLMRKQQIVIAPTKYSLTHTRAARIARNEGARIATMPDITLEMFTRGGITADFSKVKDSITNVGSRLKRKRSVQVTCDSGTNVEFEVEPRRWKLEDNGICSRPGQLTNLPAGKVFTMPKEGTMNGVIVFDGSWQSTLLDEPLKMYVTDGLVTSIDGGKIAEVVDEMYDAQSEKLPPKLRELVWTVAEFGFGMNPKARLIGNVLEDEKVKGTCYFAVGDNSILGGSANVGIHVTGVIKAPTVHLEEMVLIEGGELVS